MATLSPPGSPQQNQERPRAVTAMSYASTHSHKSSRSREEKKLDLVETSRDKRRLEGKANPMKALHEAQPAAVALEDSTLENVRTMQYRDREGNIIADPDRSNPTRPRMERPLDTIRSFNAAAEGTTSRRSSYQRPPSQFNGFDAQSRRNSSYGSPNNSYSQGPRGPQNRGPGGPGGPGGYYNRHNSYGPRPDQGDSDYYQGQSQGQGYPPRQQRFQSAPMNMETQMNMGPSRVAPASQHAHQQSYETMNTNISGSGSDEMSKSTNPSSQNSSFDQLHQIGRKPDEHHNPYYSNGRPNGAPMRTQYPPSAMMNNPQNQQWSGRQFDDYGLEVNAPPPPPKTGFMNGVREMAPASGGRNTSPAKGEKRQSWLKRTFSKKV